MTYILAVLLITICSLLHDGDYPAVWGEKWLGEKYAKYLGKWIAFALHGGALAYLLNDYGVWGYITSLTSVAIFWGIFRRGWIAKAELTAIRLKDEPSINAIVKAYPPYLGYTPKYITIGILKLPFEAYYRRIQSGLIALLWTGHLSALPVLLLGAL
jgi:hypothetical protein